MTSLVDTHCHLDLEWYDEDRSVVLERAVAAGVHAMILIGYNPDRWTTTSEMCARWPFLRRTVGIHPNDAEMWTDEIGARLCQEVESSSPIAIGEIGLDFYRSTDTDRQQRVAFITQLEIATKYKLPVVIHQRMAEKEVIDILEQFKPLSGVMHCFSGDAAFAMRCLELGFHLGIGGAVTYPRSGDLRDAVEGVPVDRLVLETDAPYLAPQSARGKRNEPALMTEVLLEVARVRVTTVDDLAAETTANAVGLFGATVSEAITAGMEY